MTQWEYTTCLCRDTRQNLRANELGLDGWEAYAVTLDGEIATTYFKREVGAFAGGLPVGRGPRRIVAADAISKLPRFKREKVE